MIKGAAAGDDGAGLRAMPPAPRPAAFRIGVKT
jgi:hypothetical protein